MDISKLDDLRALRCAVASEKKATEQLLTSPHYRQRRVHNVVKAIRKLRIALGQAMQELLYLRGATNGTIANRVADFTARIKQLDRMIVHEEQRVRIARMLKLKEAMDALNAEVGMGPAPAEPDMSEDPDDELIIS